MRCRVLDLRYSAPLGGIDDEPLQRALHGHEALEVREHFYLHDGVPHLLVTVLYRLASLAGPPAQARPQRAGAPSGQRGPDPGAKDWRQLLDEETYPLFETLRAWRTARARAEAVPPYVILTNDQLAEIARGRPRTLKALGDVQGLGESRLQRFGEEVLEVISRGVVRVEGAGEPATSSATP